MRCKKTLRTVRRTSDAGCSNIRGDVHRRKANASATRHDNAVAVATRPSIALADDTKSAV